MATYRLSLSTVKRSAGRSVVAAVAYQHAARLEQREGQHFYAGKVVHDYSRKAGVLDSFLMVPRQAPDWARDRDALWNAAELAENRKNSVTGRELILSLPHELDLADHQAMTRRFGERLVRRYGVAVDIAIHAPSKDGDQRNVHAHLMMTTRKLGAEGFGEKTRLLDENRPQLQRDEDGNPVLDADGKKRYTPARGPQEVQWMREEWAGIENTFLRDRGLETVDHRSLKEQGSDREPQPKRGVAATAMERRGISTERGAAVETHLAQQAERAVVGRSGREAANDSTAAPEKGAAAKPRHAQTRLEREAEALDAWRVQKISQLSAQQADDLDALSARQSAQRQVHAQEMETAYGDRRAQTLERIAAIAEELQANGVRRVVGRMNGRDTDLRRELSALRAGLRDGRTREQVATKALAADQAQARAERAAEHQAQLEALQDRLQAVKGLHGAKRYDQAERAELARRGQEQALARYDRENPGVAPPPVAREREPEARGLGGAFEAARDQDNAPSREAGRGAGQDLDLDR